MLIFSKLFVQKERENMRWKALDQYFDFQKKFYIFPQSFAVFRYFEDNWVFLTLHALLLSSKSALITLYSVGRSLFQK